MQAHDALDDDAVSMARAFDGAIDRLRPHGPQIDILGAARAGPAMKGRVDIVGSDLEGGNLPTCRLERCQQAESDSRLAMTGCRCRDEDPGRA